jgi:beta-glucosidase
MEATLEDTIAGLTLEEKISMLAGADHWTTVPVERLGIPALKMSDGPIGARGAQSRGGPTSACFPAGVALAATWNPELVGRVGEALAEDARAKGVHLLLAPTVNIQRSPLAGRNFECYSEDPYLAARMAVAYIRGLQSRGVGACIKHFVCNDSEFERRGISSEVRERALHEIYLTPFRVAVREARPWAVMSAYNKLNGTYCSENRHLLLEILKGEWGFDGMVVSDWFGTYSPAVAGGGLDLEMPGPARWMGAEALAMVEAGLVGEAEIDDKIRRLLRTLHRAGAFEHPEPASEQAIDRPEDRLLARQAAAEAIVLLKNRGAVLPLDPTGIRSIAVIGENARWAEVQGGGSTHVSPHYVVSPLDGIRSRAGDGIEVGYQTGCIVHKSLPPIDAAWLTTQDGSEQGLTVEFYGNLDLSGDPVHTLATASTEHYWFGESVPGVDPTRFSARFMGHLTAPETGTYQFGLMSVGRARLLLDGRELVDGGSGSSLKGPQERIAEADLEAGRRYRLEIEYRWDGGPDWRIVRLGCEPPVPDSLLEDAVALAAASDVAIVVAGLTDEWESEGHDRVDMELPGRQAELIQRVAAANPNTIVVLNAGSPLRMPWLDDVPAVVQSWYLGQETGNAIAAVLFGDVNPSGKLPLTFPVRLEDNPAYINYPGENGRVHYGEGIFAGYRYYDKKGIEPLFTFGYGLSYTTFEYRNLVVEQADCEPGTEVSVRVDVENTGDRAGQEVVQLYVRDLESRLMRPPKELKAFAKVMLKPGEKRTATTLAEEDLAYYDPGRGGWLAEPGEFEVLVGSSSRDIRLTARFRLLASKEERPAQKGRLNPDLPLRLLLADPAAVAVLEKHLPGVTSHPMVSLVGDLTLEDVAQMAAGMVSELVLEAIREDLAAL